MVARSSGEIQRLPPASSRRPLCVVSNAAHGAGGCRQTSRMIDSKPILPHASALCRVPDYSGEVSMRRQRPVNAEGSAFAR